MVVDHSVPARVVVCESSHRWAVALRRQLSTDVCGEICEICETRHLDDCWEQAGGGWATAAVWEVRLANLASVVRELRRYQTDLPRVPVFIVGRGELSAAQWLLRAAGAVETVFSRRQLGPLVRMLQRHWQLARPGHDTPAPWLRLPWGPPGDSAGVVPPGAHWLHGSDGPAAPGTTREESPECRS